MSSQTTKLELTLKYLRAFVQPLKATKRVVMHLGHFYYTLHRSLCFIVFHHTFLLRDMVQKLLVRRTNWEAGTVVSMTQMIALCFASATSSTVTGEYPTPQYYYHDPPPQEYHLDPPPWYCSDSAYSPYPPLSS